jgi:hypothetical protein
MDKRRIATAVAIINHAVSYNTSIKKACVQCGYSDTYVKNVKRELYLEEEANGMASIPEADAFRAALSYYALLKNQKAQNPPTDALVLPDGEYLKNKVLDQKNQFKSPGVFVKERDTQYVPPTSSPEKETFKQEGNKAEYEWVGGTSYPKDHIRTLDQLLKAANVDLELWKVKNHTINKWDVTSWKNGEPDTRQNFQVKANLERIEEMFKSKSAAEIFRDMVKDYKAPILKVIPQNFSIQENNLLEISIFDLHIGKLAWGGETFENYDTKIARSRFLGAIETLVHRASGFPYNRILFPVGNDFFNSDTIYNTTTKGTPQDEDLRWQKTFKVGTRLLVDAINMLKQTGVPVDVVVIPGNHDFERSYYMGEYLDAWFNNDPVVNVNNHASPRKYYRFGKVLLGLTHGSEEKESSLPLLMATDIESKPYWSDTKYHEWHLGHIHRKRNVNYGIVDKKERSVNEDLGVTIRYLSSLTGTEEWHHKKGFVGSIKAADAFIWNDELGLMAHLNSNLTTDCE